MLIVLVVLSLFLSSCASELKSYRFIKAIDGDSLVLQNSLCPEGVEENPNGSEFTIDCHLMETRLLGIDTPEYSQQVWGKIARDYSQAFFKDGQAFVEFGVEDTDKYGRKLAYVLNAEGKMINEELLRSGLAVLFITSDNSKYALQLKKAEAEARTAQLRIWDKDKGLKQTPYEYRRANKSR